MESKGIRMLAAFFVGCLFLLVTGVTASPVPDDAAVVALADDDMPTNLPAPTYTGPVQGNASIVIDAPLEKVWAAVIDFPSYPQWNPFVRSQVVTDKDKNPLPDQAPVEDAYLVMKVHIPPSLDDSIPTISVFEQITHVQPDLHRVAWNSTLPSWFVKAERWQAVSATEDGKTLYESREIFAGSGAYAIKLFISGDLEKSFIAQAEGLKAYVEGQA